jgi:ribonucleoside-diphosphate reductase alpha chain
MDADKQARRQAKTFSYQEALNASLAYFNGDELAAGTWVSKYALKNRRGELLEQTPDAMHLRMAAEFARIEEKYGSSAGPSHSEYGRRRKPLTQEAIFELFRQFRYVIPQGSVMSALGNPHMLASLSNCVVLPELYDSYGGIFYTDQQMAQLFKRRCGVGIDISTLRPGGEFVSNAAGTTSGAVSFMERFSNTTREVSQHGRRGALMITLDVAHPDIEAFVMVKQDLSKVTGANISIRISDEFMRAAAAEKEFTLRWPLDAEHPLVTKRVNAGRLWNEIVACAHATGEPGIIFWDRQHAYSTSSMYPGFKNVSTNPCSEIAMQGGDSCRLMAINLFSFVEDPFTPKATFHHQKLYEITYEAQRLMDDLVDLELESIERIIRKVENDPEPDYIREAELRTWRLLHETGSKGRRTGLGFTALADTLAALGLKFDGQAALDETEKIMRTKCAAEFDSSIDLAIERGAFAAFDKKFEEQSEFIKMLGREFPAMHARMMEYGRRNISISTVAPTGSVSILAQTSSGIEPVFMLSYKRRKKVNASDAHARVDFVDALGDSWQEYTVYHHKLREWMKVSGKTQVEESPFYKATANDIDWSGRVGLQSLVQKYTTHSISSTINLPEHATVSQVRQIYLEAWKQGLKGITVYREGARSGVLVAGDRADREVAQITYRSAPRRPQTLAASVMRFLNHNERWIAFVGLLSDRPYEIFTGRADETFDIPESVQSGWISRHKGSDAKTRYDFEYLDTDGKRVVVEGLSRSFNEEYWNYAKLISGVLRHGMPLLNVLDLVQNLHLYNDNINTWKAGVERALRKFVPEGTRVQDKVCPSCGDKDGLIYEEGCLKCKSCGFSQCG